MFVPVDLVDSSGNRCTARTPVELNDLTMNGYVRARAEFPTSVRRSVAPVTPVDSDESDSE